MCHRLLNMDIFEKCDHNICGYYRYIVQTTKCISKAFERIVFYF